MYVFNTCIGTEELKSYTTTYIHSPSEQDLRLHTYIHMCVCMYVYSYLHIGLSVPSKLPASLIGQFPFAKLFTGNLDLWGDVCIHTDIQ